jgi:hypothetical protein
MSALPLVVVPSGNSSTGGKSWQEAFLMISIAAFFLESGDNLSTGITYNTRMSKHKMTLKIYNPGMMQRRLERMEDGRRIVGFVGEDDCGYGKQTLVDVGSTHLHGLNYSANKGDAFVGIGAHNTWKELEEVEDRVHEAYMVGDHNWSNFSSGWLSCALYPMKSEAEEDTPST